MPSAARPSPDPLAEYARPAVISGTLNPVPLIGTAFSVAIDAGLAVVTTVRRFRNAEDDSIEVTMTFPVPIHATMFDLWVQIGERRLRAHARAHDEARDAYEDAIDRGHTAVLHEEVLRGVHQLAIAHVPPGAEIGVETRWAMPLAAVPGGGRLHIPVTVGDVYGRSPLPDSDDLFHTADVQEAELTVACGEGIVALSGGLLTDGRATLRLDAPIQLTVTGWRPRVLRGVAADGRAVGLRIAPAEMGALALDAAILVDRSGSMDEAASGLPSSGAGMGSARTKHAVVVSGLLETATTVVGPHDRIDLWEFDTAAALVPGHGLADAVGRLAEPAGGTEIGAAIDAVLGARPTRDVLLITDGKSHALDVQRAAASGRRFHVVLIGEDSLEANVGHLAALTGGQVFLAAGVEAGGMIRQAIAAMRQPHVASAPIIGAPTSVEAMVAGMRVEAAWDDRPDAEPGLRERAVAAVAAFLAFPRMPRDAASALAEAEGLVTHLTSLVVVDEAGEVQDGLPAQRRVGLMTPRTQDGAIRWRDSSGTVYIDIPIRQYLRAIDAPFDEAFDADEPRAPSVPCAALLACRGQIDWASRPGALRRGDLSRLPPAVARAVQAAASHPRLVALATTLGLPPVVLVLVMLADSERDTSRAAARFAQAVLGNPTGWILFARAALRQIARQEFGL
jgi:hypothetical protein